MALLFSSAIAAAGESALRGVYLLPVGNNRASLVVELENAGLLERTVIDARPPRVEYRLTADGRRLRAVLDALAAYAST